MARLVWGSVGQKLFETGVDRGVLYPKNRPGVAWNGITAINESPTGGEVKKYYIDGYNYLNLVGPEEYSATIEAYTYPIEFEECDGISSVYDGLYATQQPRKGFDLCYRTRIGNDVSGTSHGYKIHLIYNAIVSPTERNNQTLSETSDLSLFSWPITARPVAVPSRKPTAHLVIDSLRTPPSALVVIENTLYGTDVLAPRFLQPTELLNIFWANDTPEAVFTSTFGESF